MLDKFLDKSFHLGHTEMSVR